jgi:hypothetical protein
MKISKFINYSADMCWNGQGITVVGSPLVGLSLLMLFEFLNLEQANLELFKFHDSICICDESIECIYMSK